MEEKDKHQEQEEQNKQEMQEQQPEAPNFHGMFEGATLNNCTQNFIWGNKTVHVHSNARSRSDAGDEDFVKQLLKDLLDATIEVDGKTVKLMTDQKQWYAVYRVMNEKLNYPKKMTDFQQVMAKMGFDKGRVPCVYTSLTDASKTVPKLACTVTLWSQYKDLSDSYSKQFAVADFLLNALA